MSNLSEIEMCKRKWLDDFEDVTFLLEKLNSKKKLKQDPLMLIKTNKQKDAKMWLFMVLLIFRITIVFGESIFFLLIS